MDQYVKRLVVSALHGRFDIDIDFSDDVNVVHGANGTGKTTILHILANAINLDLERFTHLRYDSIQLNIANGVDIKLLGRPAKRPSHITDVELLVNNATVGTWPQESEEHPDRLGRQQRLQRKQEAQQAKEQLNILLDATYIPAFRTMIEAWSTLSPLPPPRLSTRQREKLSMARLQRQAALRETRRSLSGIYTATELARDFFGDFVPKIVYPSPRQIERRIDHEIQRAVNRIASEDRSLLSNAFNKIFNAISQDPKASDNSQRPPGTIRESISEQLDRLQSTQAEYGLAESHAAFVELKSQIASSQLTQSDQDDSTHRILEIYDETLAQRTRNLDDAYRRVRQYIDSVNAFLHGKQLVTATHDVETTPGLQIRHDDNTLSPLETLSSGERQIAGLIYSASQVAKGNIVLVDEPELSLHIDWQRQVLRAMLQQLPSKQLIVCTHSPIIGSDYLDNMIELLPNPTKSPALPVQDSETDEMTWLTPDEIEDAD